MSSGSGIIKVAQGSSVKIKSDGRVGTVLALNAERTGNRGRPKTFAAIAFGDGSEVTLPVAELKLV